MELLWELSVKNEIESKHLAKSRLFQNVTPYCMRFEGVLGAGKTFFCKCIASMYGVDDITSNSFMKYSLNKGNKKIFHIDYYYTKEPHEFFFNYVYDEIDDQSLILSEWTPDDLVIDLPQYTLKTDLVEKLKERLAFRA